VEEEHIKENLFLEMKNFSLSFHDKRFDIDIVPRKKDSRFYELYIGEKELYILIPFPNSPQDLLKIFYPKSAYTHLLAKTQKTLLWQFLLLTFIAMMISLLFSFYVLKPLRESLQMLEVFIKDIIHDLNTPLTSILINLKMMDSKNEEVESIGRSAKTIAMLHQNLDAYLKEQINQSERFRLDTLVKEQIDFFQAMYDYLNWQVDVDPLVVQCDKNALGRVIYNLLSNACKYNTGTGFVHIRTEGTTLTISNSSYGIKSPDRIFERFYKESDRGLGIGLHIVKKLCDQLEIPIRLEIKNNTVHFHLDLSKVTSK
jgi:two-component system OmpR family sensor kinase